MSKRLTDPCLYLLASLSDIFPPALSADAALTAADWFGGKTADPKFVSSINFAPVQNSGKI